MGDELQKAHGAHKLNLLVYLALVICIGTSLVNLGCIFYYIREMSEVKCTKHTLCRQIRKYSDEQNIRFEDYSDVRQVDGANVERLDIVNKSVETDKQVVGVEQEILGVRIKRGANKQGRKNKKGQKQKNRNKCKARKAAQYVGAIPEKSEEFIEFAGTSTWVTERGSPVRNNNNTQFIVKTAGLYFVYAQILFNGYEPAKYAAILHEGQSGTEADFKCKTGLFIGNSAAKIARPQTCTIVGLVKAKSGDKLRVQNESYAKVDKLKNTVYFGIMKMS